MSGASRDIEVGSWTDDTSIPADEVPGGNLEAPAPIRAWAAFGIEIETCAGCGGRLRIIASIEEPEVIAGILSHLERTACEQEQPQLPLGAGEPEGA